MKTSLLSHLGACAARRNGAARVRRILHRAVAVVCVMAMLGTAALLAQRGRRRSTGPRALALLEIAPNGRARLVPISILINGKFYDAGFYRADPRPMALDPETVYEVERSGESVGLFTVTSAATNKAVWIGLGQWRPHNAAVADTKESKPTPKAMPPTDTDEPPVLRKPKAPGTEVKPGESSTPPAQPQESAQKPEPTQKAASTPEPKAEARATTPPEDPDRPTLRRGKPTTTHVEDEQAPLTAEKPGAVAVAGKTASAQPANPKAGTGPMEVLTAISDAGGPETKSFLMELRPEERRINEDKVRAMAYQAIQKFATIRPQHRPAPVAELHETQFQAFDVNSNNEPAMVMTAALPELPPTRGAKSNFQYYATVVARVDMYGELHQLFAEVSDSTHLDAYPRMELIDAVDAEGSGTGQLLFRQVSDTGFNYALYRVGLDKLWPLFESASKNF